MKHAYRYLLLALFAIASLTAQKSGGTTTAPPSSGNSGTGSPTTPSRPQQSPLPSQQPQQNQQDIQMPVFISGRILMDDGTPTGTNIAIQRVCSNSPHTVAYANGRGQFSFQWGSPTGIVPDASESGGFGQSPFDNSGAGATRGSQAGGGSSSMNMLGCELIANAPGYRSDRIDLSNHRAGDNPDIGTIVLHRLAAVEGTSVSATSINAPKDARKAWEKGEQLLRKSKGAEAEKELHKAVDLYPKFANAWLDLGRARLQQKQVASAREALVKATEADSKLVEPYLELGQLAAREQNWPDAARYFDRALQLDPVDYPGLWFEDAVANYNVHNYERAEKNAREALKVPLASRNPRANQLLGLLLYDKQDYAGAGEALRTYVKLSPGARDLEQVKTQLQQIDRQLAATQ